MGWTQYPGVTLTYQQAKAEIIRLCAPHVPTHVSKVGSTWYAATPVGAFIFLTKTRGGWWNRGLEETEGPREARAPRSLIAALPPTTNANALDWRARCLAYADRLKLKPGDKIRLSAPVYFRQKPQTDFTVVSYGNRKCFHNPEVGPCRLRPYSLEGATLL